MMHHLPKETVPGGKPFTAGSDVYLEAAHICIRNNIADKIFGAERVVLSVFYPKDGAFMVAPAGEELFRTIHKASQQMLKTRNSAGDKAIPIQELLLDHEIDDHDRDLEYAAEESLHILKIKL
jgi:hypothetical protein